MAKHSVDKKLKHLAHLHTNELTFASLIPQEPKIRGKINKSEISGSGNSASLREQRELPMDYRTPRLENRENEGWG